MTNFEKYKDDILRIAAVDDTPALEKGKVLRCNYTACEKCEFANHENGNCNHNLFKWLYAEYKEPAPKLTSKERAFCEVISVFPNRYIARGSDSQLILFCGKPIKEDQTWDIDWCGSYFSIDEDFFPFIKWEDEEPWSIEDLLKLEVE